MEKFTQFVKDKKEYLILFVVAFAIMLPFVGGNYVAGNDTNFHMSNVYVIFQTIINGSIGLDKILPIIGNDFGYGVGIFYPRFAHTVSAYISALFLGNVTAGLKMVHFLVYFFSGVLMYTLTYKVFKNKFVAMLAGIFYITFPYSISEVFVRDALAESFVYLFMPMVLLGLYELFNRKQEKVLRMVYYRLCGYAKFSFGTVCIFYSICIYIFNFKHKKSFHKRKFCSISNIISCNITYYSTIYNVSFRAKITWYISCV